MGLEAPCWPRSRPDATAPNVSERAIAAKIPFDIPFEISLEVKLEAEVALDDCAMFANPLAPWRSGKQRGWSDRGSRGDDHLTVSLKKIRGGGNDFGGLGIFPAAGHPPAPLTGDVGRGCGDASRALLFRLILPCRPPSGWDAARREALSLLVLPLDRTFPAFSFLLPPA